MVACEHCQKHLIAYVNDELSPRLQRGVAEHLAACEACYAEYVRERDLAHQLTQKLRVLGATSKTELSAIWANVESALETPVKTTPRRSNGWQRQLVGLAVAVLIMLPWSLSLGNFANGSLQVGITPALVPQNGTPEGDVTETGAAHVVALNHESSDAPTEDVLPPTATSTPAVAPNPNQ